MIGKISKKIGENLAQIKEIYDYPQNSDIVIKEFTLGETQFQKAFVVYIEGMTDVDLLNQYMVRPLMRIEKPSHTPLTCQEVYNHYLIQVSTKVETELQKAIETINFGGAVIFVDGDANVLCAEVRKYEHRTVQQPTTENVVLGPQDSFNEVIRNNTALIRQRLQDENLRIESVKVGKRSQTACAVIYMKNIANPQIVQEVKRRLSSISVDIINDSGEIEQFIEDSTFNPFPQMLKTERPDLVVEKIAEGKVVILVHGTPFALVMPVDAAEFMETMEDKYIRFPYVELMKVIRVVCIFLSLVFPGLYVAILNYHQEVIPSTLLYAIEASREQVPFSTVAELLIMVFIFDILSEASVRTPKPIGATFGIVGALVLGEAAVSAQIVSPVLIIVIAVCGIGTFVIPNYSFSFSIRVMKYFFILAAALAGIFGITLMIFLSIILLLSSKSFGVPLLSPDAKEKSSSLFYRKPIWKEELRPEKVQPQDVRRQPVYSRKWIRRKK